MTWLNIQHTLYFRQFLSSFSVVLKMPSYSLVLNYFLFISPFLQNVLWPTFFHPYKISKRSSKFLNIKAVIFLICLFKISYSKPDLSFKKKETITKKKSVIRHQKTITELVKKTIERSSISNHPLKRPTQTLIKKQTYVHTNMK